MIRTVFWIVNEEKVDILVAFPCFLYEPTKDGNLNSGSTGFSKSNLYIWSFCVHILLKPILKDFEHYLASMCNKCSWYCLWDWNGKWPFPVLRPLLFSKICWHIEYSTFAASSFRIWNSSTGISSPSLTLFIVVLPKAHFTLDSRMSGSRLVITPLWLSESWSSFLYSSSVYSCYLFLASSASVRSFLCLSFAVPICAWHVSLVSPIFLKRSLVFPILLISSISFHVH